MSGAVSRQRVVIYQVAAHQKTVHTGDDTRRHGAIENGNTRSIESLDGVRHEIERKRDGGERVKERERERERERGEARAWASLGEVRQSGASCSGVRWRFG